MYERKYGRISCKRYGEVLKRKYAELKGGRLLIDKKSEDLVGRALRDYYIEAESALALVDRQLRAVECMLIAEDPEFRGDEIMPLVGRRSRLDRGAIKRAMFRVLESAKSPLTRRQIARGVNDLLDLGLDEASLKRTESSIYGHLRRLADDVVELYAGRPQRFKLEKI